MCDSTDACSLLNHNTFVIVFAFKGYFLFSFSLVFIIKRSSTNIFPHHFC